MKGLVFELSIPKYVLAKGLGKALPALHYGKLSCLSLREVERPKLPGPGWVRLRSRLAGLCGSDLATFFFKASVSLEPFNSFPAVLGHEILAEVAEVPDGVTGLEVGQRVTVEPTLPCRLRGFQTPCRACARGQEGGCEHVAEGCLAPGMLLGYHRDLPGGMGTELVAHVSQLHTVPDGIPDRAAVLTEPLSVATHAVLRHPPLDADRVLVIGGGPVGFATLWALRALGHRCQVTMMVLEAWQVELAKRLGADEVMHPAPEKEEAQDVARRTGGKVYQPILGPPVLAGGFDSVFDCVGSERSLSSALRYTRSHGRVVLIGAASVLQRIDWTPVWKNELTVAGTYVYGMEEFRGRRLHTFDVVRELLSRREGPDPSVLVTHVLPLERYKEAIEANVHRGRHQAVKTVFDLTAETKA